MVLEIFSPYKHALVTLLGKQKTICFVWIHKHVSTVVMEP